MVNKPIIAFVGEIGVNDEIDNIIDGLFELDKDGQLIMDVIGPHDRLKSKKYNAIVFASDIDIELTIDDLGLNETKNSFHIAALSAKAGYLKQLEDNSRIKIFKLPEISPRHLAEFTTLLVRMLLLRIGIALFNGKSGESATQALRQENMEGKTWLILGAGHQAQWLIAENIMTGIENFIVWDEKMDDERFHSLFSHLSCYPSSFKTGSINERINIYEKTAPYEVKVYKGKCNSKNSTNIVSTIKGVGSVGLKKLLKEIGNVDILSVHDLSSDQANVDNESDMKWPTKDLVHIDSDIIDLLTDTLLINTACGGILNEKDIVSDFKKSKDERHLGGVAVCVIDKKQKEINSNSSRTPLEYLFFDNYIPDDGFKHDFDFIDLLDEISELYPGKGEKKDEALNNMVALIEKIKGKLNQQDSINGNASTADFNNKVNLLLMPDLVGPDVTNVMGNVLKALFNEYDIDFNWNQYLNEH